MIKNSLAVMGVNNRYPVAVLSKMWVCRHLIAGTAGSNPADDMDISLLYVA
jgi:hypothetical protein